MTKPQMLFFLICKGLAARAALGTLTTSLAEKIFIGETTKRYAQITYRTTKIDEPAELRDGPVKAELGNGLGGAGD